jgi:hypothetical protein
MLWLGIRNALFPPGPTGGALALRSASALRRDRDRLRRRPFARQLDARSGRLIR